MRCIRFPLLYLHWHLHNTDLVDFIKYYKLYPFIFMALSREFCVDCIWYIWFPHFWHLPISSDMLGYLYYFFYFFILHLWRGKVLIAFEVLESVILVQLNFMFFLIKLHIFLYFFIKSFYLRFLHYFITIFNNTYFFKSYLIHFSHSEFL